jgi:hypothetical protein
MAVFKAPMQQSDKDALAKEMKKRAPTVDYQSGGFNAAVNIQLNGLQSLIDNLKDLPKYAIDAAGSELQNICRDIIVDSRTNYVPYEYGDLQDSAGWDEWNEATMSAKDIIEMRVWFGAELKIKQSRKAIKAAIKAATNEGATKDVDPSVYAWEQHENLSFNHPNVGVVTNPQNKYLEKPFLDMEPKILGRVATAISRVWGSDLLGSILTSSAHVSTLEPVFVLKDDQ